LGALAFVERWERVSETSRELEAMAKVAAVIEPLDADERGRVLSWAAERFSVVVSTRNKSTPALRQIDSVTPPVANDFAELYHQAAPDSDVEKALVAAYWLQEVSQINPFDAKSANDELKHLGYPIGNIARALGLLGEGQPRLVIQVSTSGSSKQARKKYRLTEEGIRRVRAMIAEQQSAE
jgi:hypothetical protein